MNLVDIAVVAVLALGLLIGWYHGFLRAAANVGAILLAIVIALAAGGGVARKILDRGKVIPQLIYYSESDVFLGDVEIIRAPVEDMTPEALDQYLADTDLPHPVESRLRQNLADRAFAEEGLTLLGEYLSMTLAHLTVNIACFLGIFLLSVAALWVLVHALDFTVQFPVLRYGDSVAGGLVGLVGAALLLFALETVIPIGLSFVPFEELRSLIEHATTSALFYQSNFLLALMKGVILSI